MLSFDSAENGEPRESLTCDDVQDLNIVHYTTETIERFPCKAGGPWIYRNAPNQPHWTVLRLFLNISSRKVSCIFLPLVIYTSVASTLGSTNRKGV